MPPSHERRGLPLFHKFCRAFADASARTVWGFRVSGREHLPSEGPLIIAGNHASLADAPLLFCAISPRRPITFLAKAELFRNPALAWFLRRCWVMPLDRKGDVSAMRGALDVLADGGCLGLFPQGTRARPGVPQRLKPGLGFLASLGRARVVPAHIIGTERFPFGRPLEVRFGPSLQFSGDPHDRAACLAFTQDVMERAFKL